MPCGVGGRSSGAKLSASDITIGLAPGTQALEHVQGVRGDDHDDIGNVFPVVVAVVRDVLSTGSTCSSAAATAWSELAHDAARVAHVPVITHRL
jgi:hypothetical protein